MNQLIRDAVRSPLKVHSGGLLVSSALKEDAVRAWEDVKYSNHKLLSCVEKKKKIVAA